MCRLLMMAGIKPENADNANKFATACLPEMSRQGNKDGVGYAAIAADGTLWGQKWLKVEDYGKTLEPPDESIKNIVDAFGGTLVNASGVTKYGSFGPVSDPHPPAVAFMLHTRLATHGQGIDNTHPFWLGGVAMIHNGVIYNHQTLPNCGTGECDSGVILRAYYDNEVRFDPTMINEVTAPLRGYFAAGFLSTDDSKAPYMDIIRDGKAGLVAAFINELDTLVFATTKDIILEGLKATGFTLKAFFDVAANSYIRLDAVTGSPLYISDIEVGYDYSGDWKTGAYAGPGSSVIDVTKMREEIERDDPTDPHYVRSGS